MNDAVVISRFRAVFPGSDDGGEFMEHIDGNLAQQILKCQLHDGKLSQNAAMMTDGNPGTR